MSTNGYGYSIDITLCQLKAAESEAIPRVERTTHVLRLVTFRAHPEERMRLGASSRRSSEGVADIVCAFFSAQCSAYPCKAFQTRVRVRGVWWMCLVRVSDVSGQCRGRGGMCGAVSGKCGSGMLFFQAAALSISICIPCLYLPIIFLDTWWALFPRVADEATVFTIAMKCSPA